MQTMDLLVLATSHFSGLAPSEAPAERKALLPRPNGEPLLARVLDAAAGVPRLRRKVVVAPAEARDLVESYADLLFLDEGTSDYDSLLRGIVACADGDRLTMCAGHLVEADTAALENLIGNAPEDATVSLPLYPKEEFKSHWPVRTAFLRLADGEFTAAPAAVVRTGALLRAEPNLRKLYDVRYNPWSLAAILGLGMIAKFLTGRLTLEDVRAKAESLVHGQCTLLRSCSPKLALSVTTPQSWEDIANLLRNNDPAS